MLLKQVCILSEVFCNVCLCYGMQQTRPARHRGSKNHYPRRVNSTHRRVNSTTRRVKSTPSSRRQPPEAETPPRKLRLRPPERSEPRAQREMGRSLNFRGGVSAEGDCRRGRGLHFTSRGLEVISRGLEDTSRGLGFFEPRFLIGQVCHS